MVEVGLLGASGVVRSPTAESEKIIPVEKSAEVATSGTSSR